MEVVGLLCGILEGSLANTAFRGLAAADLGDAGIPATGLRLVRTTAGTAGGFGRAGLSAALRVSQPFLAMAERSLEVTPSQRDLPALESHLAVSNSVEHLGHLTFICHHNLITCLLRQENIVSCLHGQIRKSPQV